MYRDFIQSVLQQAGEIARQKFGNVSATVKPDDNNQVLTEADLAVGNLIVQRIQETFPDHSIIDEEAGVIDKQSPFVWVVDPIDGTANFAVGLPDYGIMIGLLHDAKPVAGGIFAPGYDKLFLAERGKGATCNGEPIHCMTEQKLTNTLISFGADGLPNQPAVNQQQCEVLADLLPRIRNMRHSGSEAIDPMYVAEGRYGARINLSGKIWDSVAPQIICEESGATWTTANGEPYDYRNPVARARDGQNFTFCVAPPQLHAQLQKIIDGRLENYSTD